MNNFLMFFLDLLNLWLIFIIRFRCLRFILLGARYFHGHLFDGWFFIMYFFNRWLFNRCFFDRVLLIMSLLDLRYFYFLRFFRFIRVSVVYLFLRGLMDLFNWSLLLFLLNNLHNRGLVVGQQILIVFLLSDGLLMIIIKLCELI